MFPATWVLCLLLPILSVLFFFFFNDTATTEIYTLSLHDALPISTSSWRRRTSRLGSPGSRRTPRSEEHTSELQSRFDLVCRLLLEKKKKPSGRTLRAASSSKVRRAERSLRSQ